MVNLTGKEFGQPIQFKNIENADSNGYTMGANEMVSRFVDIKNLYKFDLNRLVAGNEHARRYYCENDCAYIFDVKFLRAIVETIEKHEDGNGCMVLFQGLRKDDVAVVDNEKSSVIGRPTIIATAYAANDAGLTHLKIDKTTIHDKLGLTDDDCDGFEHPGDGSSPSSLFFIEHASGKTNAQPLEDLKPIVLGSSDGDTRYTIKDKISWDDLHKWM